MTIDQLLADVTPYIPSKCKWVEDEHRVMIVCGENEIVRDTLDEELRDKLATYARHANNHFPAMLQALREIAELPEKNSIYCPRRLAWNALAAIGEREPLNHTARLEDAQAARKAGESVK